MQLPDAEATAVLGAQLAAALQPGLHIFLSGDLGAGKTTLVRGLLQSLGYVGRVKSPTYTLVESYVVSKLHLYHFDFYRFTDPEEWEAAGFRDLFNEANICLVEWPEKALSLLPAADLLIQLHHQAAGRKAELHARSPRGQKLLKLLEIRRPQASA
ncbi:MAG: tRNA (adenosine(37)-N6)-threonylcarbamoyltransferase complex ATPase subunit type 1 TsaE [Betaproteobacteria bacterium]|nr:tRNA (adenosine(37)-N6)-threonylcarbamoyltransferase complex ATPase subunit type 1 TsaE [Betaproteobacteria bacterium]